jgi:peptidylprolyl isomerase
MARIFIHFILLFSSFFHCLISLGQDMDLHHVIVMRIFTIFIAGVFSLIMSASAQSDTLVLETSKGEIRIAMLSTLAPNHVARIKELAGEGYYDGIIFHRVIPGFMAQTGDPTGTGMGGSGQKLDAEFSDYQYQSGTVGMARTMDPNSADSQFFICFDGCGHLTGQYTVWGQVEEGMDVVEAINVGEPPAEPDQIVRAYMAE